MLFVVCGVVKFWASAMSLAMSWLLHRVAPEQHHLARRYFKLGILCRFGWQLFHVDACVDHLRCQVVVSMIEASSLWLCSIGNN